MVSKQHHSITIVCNNGSFFPSRFVRNAPMVDSVEMWLPRSSFQRLGSCFISFQDVQPLPGINSFMPYWIIMDPLGRLFALSMCIVFEITLSAYAHIRYSREKAVESLNIYWVLMWQI